MNNTSPPYFCFVLMPFDEQFDDIYNFGIKAACKEANAYCERVDEQIFEETSILARIYNQIANADLIIADMTGRNPNVFYEVGYAHALNKPTVLLTQNAKDIPFDLKHYPFIVYNGKIGNLKPELTKRIEWFRNNQSANNNDFKYGLDIYVNNTKMESDGSVYEVILPSTSFELEFVIHNSSTKTFQDGEYLIGIINEFYKKMHPDGIIQKSDEMITTSLLPDGRIQHYLPYLDQLFPDSSLSYKFFYTNVTKQQYSLVSLPIVFKIYTDLGTREFNLELKRP